METKGIKTMTVGELIDFLKQYSPEDKVEIIRLSGFTQHVFPLFTRDVDYNKYSHSVEIDVTNCNIMTVSYE